MANKVLLAYVAIDALFVVMGAIMIGFTVIVANDVKQIPADGEQAARNLLYSRFPLTGTWSGRGDPDHGRWLCCQD